MSLRSTKWSMGALAALLTGAGLAMAQAPGFGDEAVPSIRPAANFTSSSLFTEGDAPAIASDSAAFDGTCGDSCSCPTWTVTADAIFLDRNPARTTLAQTIVGGTEVLNASAMHFNWASGPRLSLLRHQDDFDLELTHFDVTGWLAQASTPGSPGLIVPSPGFSGNTIGSGTLSFVNSSRLFSTEFNIRKAWTPNITALAGFRWVEFYDHLLDGDNEQVPTGIIDRRFITSNRLYGAQIGVDAVLIRRNGFELRSVVKAGIYGNAAQSFADIPFVNGNVPPQIISGGRASFLGDLNFTATYRLSPHWGVRGGYQLLWLDGVALAPNQIPVMNFANPANSTIATNNSLFAHGATVGLEAKF